MRRTGKGESGGVPRDAAPPARITLSPLAWAALGLFAVLMVGSLATQILLLEDQRTTVDRQLAVAAKQLDAIDPLLREARPFVEESRAALPQSRRLTREALPLVESATPLVQELDRARAGEQLEAAGALARSLLDARAGRNLGRLQAIADDVTRLPALTRDITRDVQRLTKLTVVADLAPHQLRTLQESLAVQRETLAAVREGVALTREGVTGVNELRAIGRDTLVEARRAANSAESLDRKLGGSLPVPTSG